MADYNWELFIVGMLVGGFLSYSVCELVFPDRKDSEREEN